MQAKMMQPQSPFGAKTQPLPPPMGAQDGADPRQAMHSPAQPMMQPMPQGGAMGKIPLPRPAVGPKAQQLPGPMQLPNSALQMAWQSLGRQNAYQPPTGYMAPQVSRRAVVPMSWSPPTPAPTQAPVYNGGEFDRSFMY